MGETAAGLALVLVYTLMSDLWNGTKKLSQSGTKQVVILLTTGGTRGVALHPALVTPSESISSSMQDPPSSDC